MLDRAESTREKILEVAEGLIFEKGLSGTSLNDIVSAAHLTKGALFHHFENKSALARAILERWAEKDYAVFKDFADRATALADDPLQEVLLFFKLMEEWVEGFDEPNEGCMFASYTYEREQFDSAMHVFISESLNEWIVLYGEKFERLLAARRPKIEGITARDLSELTASVIEGGLVLSRAFNDPQYLARQSRQLRNYLNLLFA